ncbi:MAG: GNAT family N-acetyltransferase [Xanthomonadales bacterium]|nr:GNAT family N-acetyltransferase [Xanthomonadales bacterium]
MDIRKTRNPADPGWLELRSEFMPEATSGEHRRFLAGLACESVGFCAFIASAEKPENGGGDSLMGFVEVAVRRDFVNGCKHRPALFLEGIFVRPEHRGKGVARALCDMAGAWGAEHGCREFASDVYIDDRDSLAAHRGLGFEETERVVYFRKSLVGPERPGME